MHIVHLGKYYYPAVGGMESLIRSQALAQAKSGHSVDVVAINHITRNGKDVLGKTSGITTSARDQDGPVTVHRVSRFGNIAKWDLTATLRSTLGRIAVRKPDIWHLHTPNATMVLGLQSLLRTCQPLVVTHHSDIINQRLLRPAYQLVERRVYERASLILSDSPNYISGSRQLKPFIDKVNVLPIGIDIADYQIVTDEIKHWEQLYRKQFGDPLWLCVGRLAPYKGLEVAITALQKVPGTLAIIGTGSCEAKWKLLAAQLGVSSRIHWLGRCSDSQLRAAYRCATALWFPSNARNEGFGIVQVEAMASGCPVINTDLPHSGVAWVSQHEQTGLTIPVGDWEALARASMRILQEPGLRHRLSAAALEHATNHFDQIILNNRCLELYASVLSGHEN